MNVLKTSKIANDPDESVVKELSTLIRERGPCILNGNTKLVLTTCSVYCLNRCFHRLRNLDVSDEIVEMSSVKSTKTGYSLQDNIQYLYDFVKKIVVLKVTQGTTTLQGSVNLTAFSNLEILEIKRIPIHLFVGLKSLRNQLKMITCERSLQKLEDLFAMCGGDRCSPFSWPELLAANLNFNSIESLDTSLKLLSSLVSLNVSHNFLENTDGLEYLNNLEHLNLSYNRLEHFPRLSIQACARLKVLSLRNNNLESLKGLEELSNLSKIDVAYNCLLNHCSLSPFLRLHQASSIFLEGNPISFHEQHRILTIAHLHYKARTTKCLLNGKSLNRIEIMVAKKIASSCHSVKDRCYVWNESASINSVSDQPVNSAALRDFPVLNSNYRTDEVACPNGNWSASENNLTNSAKMLQAKEKKRIRKCPLVRDAKISESSVNKSSPWSSPKRPFDTNQMECKLSPHPMEVSGDHLQTKEEIEKCRQKHGREWLVIGARLSVLSTTDEQSTKDDNEMSLLLPKTYEDISSIQKKYSSQLPEANDDVIVLNEDTQQSSCLLPSTQIVGSSHLIEYIASDQQLLSLHPKHIPDEFPWEHVLYQASDSDLLDEDACSSPFIVQLEKRESSDVPTVLVVICRRDIREKDFVTGQTIERLELRNIKSLDILPPKISVLGDAIHKFPRVRLTFNYIRTERKERTYVLEDDENCKQFVALLAPVIEAMTLEEMMSGALQCLKCSSHFSKEVAKRVNPKSQRPIDDIVVLSSSAENLKEHLREEIACPNCGSEMLTESDHSTLLSISSASKGELLSAQVSRLEPPNVEKSLLEAPNQNIPVSFLTCESKKRHVDSALGSSCPANYGVAEIVSQVPSLHFKGDSVQVSTDSYVTPEVTKRYGTHFKSEISPSSIECCSVLEVEVEVHSSQKPDHETEKDPHFSYSLTTTDTHAIDSSGLKRTESDITILSNPSQSSIMVMPNPSTELMLDAISENSLDCNRQMAKLHSNMLAAVQDPSCVHAEEKKLLIPQQPAKFDSGSSGSLTGSACTTVEKSVYDSYCGETPESFVSALSVGDMPQSSNLSSKSCDHIKKYATDLHNMSTSSAVSEMYTEPINDTASYSSLVKNDTLSNFSESDKDAMLRKSNVKEQFHVGKPLIWSCQNGDVKYSFQDFGQVDHRLKLYLDLKVLNTDDELIAVLRGGMVPYVRGEEWPGLLVISHKKVYVMKIVGPEIDQPKLWLQKFTVHPINQLHFLNVRLGCQAFQLEFGPKSSPICYTVILRDADNCNNFMCFIMEKLKGGLLDLPESQLKFGLDSDETLQTIREQLLRWMSDDHSEVNESPILHYVMGYWTTQGKIAEPVSLLTTSSDILIFTEDFHWPLPHLIIPSNDVFSKSPLTLLMTWKIQDLAAVEHNRNSPLEIYLKFSNEDTREETSEIIAFETERSLHTFLQVLRSSWERLFGVDLLIC